MSLIEMNNIKKKYGKDEGELYALRGINLSVERGEMVAIMGPSGSGKSTLLNIIGLLDVESYGEYKFQNESVNKLSEKQLSSYRNKYIGFVVQNFALIDDYTVFENIEVPLIYSKVNKKKRKESIINTLKKLGIEDKKDKLPKQLSGGQNQRVAIARALVNDPEIILADEPTGALDKENGEEVMNILSKLNKEGKTIIIITHDKDIAKKCKRIIYIEDGKAKEDENEN